MRLWDAGTRPQLVAAELAAPEPAGTVAISDGATATADGDVVRLERDDGTSAELTGHRGGSRALVLARGRAARHRVGRQHLILWDVESGRALRVLRGHFGTVSDARFSADGRWIVTAGPRSVGVWKAVDGELTRLLFGPEGRSPPRHLDDARSIVAGHRGGRRRLVRVPDLRRDPRAPRARGRAARGHGPRADARGARAVSGLKPAATLRRSAFQPPTRTRPSATRSGRSRRSPPPSGRATASRPCSARPAPGRRRRWRGSSRRPSARRSSSRTTRRSPRSSATSSASSSPRTRSSTSSRTTTTTSPRPTSAGRPLHREGLLAERRHRAAAAVSDLVPPYSPDTVVVASVSCIYGLGSPEEWRERVLILEMGEEHDRDAALAS